MMSPELATKRLELLKETLPRTARVAVIWNPEVRAKRMDWMRTQTAESPALVVIKVATTVASIKILDIGG